MSREIEFIERWHSERAIYQAWGDCVSDTLASAVSERIAPISLDYFLKASRAPRLKDDRKLIEKAFYRKKNYTDPYALITDKVGLRFVVLLGREITHVAESVRSIAGWTWSMDRDYEEEQKRNPIEFGYAAVHFIVRSEADTEYGDVRIPAGTPCEVQIKTVLQHAYSELTHDTIYKPQINATPAMQRNAAKAMALLEATNDYFEKVTDEVNAALASVREITANLSAVYSDVIGLTPIPSLTEGLLLEAYENRLTEDYLEQVKALLTDKRFLVERIKERVALQNPLFLQPSILLAYLDIERRGDRALRSWPLTPKEMEPLLNDLGASHN